MIKIEFRPMHIAFFYTVAAIFILVLLLYVPGLPQKGKLVVSTIGFMFSAYFYLITHWRETTVINKESGMVTSERGIAPFRSVREAVLKEFCRVAVVGVARQVGSGPGSYAIMLQRDAGDDFLLICCFSASKAWKYAVTVARDLNFPLNDRLWSEDKVWSCQDLLLVPTWRDRKRVRQL